MIKLPTKKHILTNRGREGGLLCVHIALYHSVFMFKSYAWLGMSNISSSILYIYWSRPAATVPVNVTTDM